MDLQGTCPIPLPTEDLQTTTENSSMLLCFLCSLNFSLPSCYCSIYDRMFKAGAWQHKLAAAVGSSAKLVAYNHKAQWCLCLLSHCHLQILWHNFTEYSKSNPLAPQDSQHLYDLEVKKTGKKNPLVQYTQVGYGRMILKIKIRTFISSS